MFYWLFVCLSEDPSSLEFIPSCWIQSHYLPISLLNFSLTPSTTYLTLLIDWSSNPFLLSILFYSPLLLTVDMTLIFTIISKSGLTSDVSYSYWCLSVRLVQQWQGFWFFIFNYLTNEYFYFFNSYNSVVGFQSNFNTKILHCCSLTLSNPLQKFQPA